MRKPRIGITTSYNDGTQKISHYYIHAIEKAGGIPLIVPMLETEDATNAFAELLDGLVMTGGPGITRNLQGELPEDLEPVDEIRDTSDERIYRAFSNRPLLGICYGMQFINAMHGGAIYGDLHVEIKDSLNHSASRGGHPHPITIKRDTHFHRIMNLDTIAVNTYHKQALARVGDGLRVSAVATDGVIEGIESDDGRILGLQFHPERMGKLMQPLFNDFITRCRT